MSPIDVMSGLLALKWLPSMVPPPGLEDEDDVEDFRDGFEYKLSSEWLMEPESLLKTGICKI